MREPLKVISSEDSALIRELKVLLGRYGFEVITSPRRAQFLKASRTGGWTLTVRLLRSATGELPDGTHQNYRSNESVPLKQGKLDSSPTIAQPQPVARNASRNTKRRQESVGAFNGCLSPNPEAARNESAVAEAFDLAEGHLMIGDSAAMRQIKAYIKKVAPTDSSVLITGETGTGKELVARLILKNSLRRQGPFVCINCAAIPESLLESELFGYERGAFTGATSSRAGKLELANGGTVFLDEIGDMSAHAQAKVLRVIESKEVQRLGGKKDSRLDIRIIAATNHDLGSMVGDDRFRKDLYFRLNVAVVELPPLRQRKPDIPLLLDHFIREFNRRFGREVEGFTDTSLQYLLNYNWPGNVRELKNVIEGSFLNLPPYGVGCLDLPAPLLRRFGEPPSIPPDERDRLLSALGATNWNKSEAARNLKWSRMTLYRKLAKYQLT